MSTLLQSLHDGSLAAGTAGFLYTGTSATAALASVLARTPEQHRDARETLKVLLRRYSG
jgi:hypothetical protein